MTVTHINFDAPAELRKWPSLRGQRVKDAASYLVVSGTLGQCIQAFLPKHVGGRHLYEIHTAPQTDVVTEVLPAEHVAELARLQEYL